MSSVPPTRLSGCFSLEEASRLYRRTRRGTRVRCPTCGAGMRSVMSVAVTANVQILQCSRCGRSAIFDRPADEEGPDTLGRPTG